MNIEHTFTTVYCTHLTTDVKMHHVYTISIINGITMPPTLPIAADDPSPTFLKQVSTEHDV